MTCPSHDGDFTKPSPDEDARFATPLLYLSRFGKSVRRSKDAAVPETAVAARHVVFVPLGIDQVVRQLGEPIGELPDPGALQLNRFEVIEVHGVSQPLSRDICV